MIHSLEYPSRAWPCGLAIFQDQVHDQNPGNNFLQTNDALYAQRERERVSGFPFDTRV